jgi:hypothetical protein
MPRSSDPGKLAVWRERFERLSSSGLAVGPFCAREGVSTASFYYWRKKLGVNGRPGPHPLLGPRGRSRLVTQRQSGLRSEPTDRHSGLRSRRTDRRPRLRTGPAERRGRFQQVAVIPGTSPVPATAPVTGLPAGMVCIQLPCGTRIEVSAEDLDALRAVVAEVMRADCGLEGVMPTFGRQVVRAGRAWAVPGRAGSGRGVGAVSC